MNEVVAIDFSTYTNIVVLTGAGISVASGLPTFRGSGSIGEESSTKKYTSVEAVEQDPAGLWHYFSNFRITARQAIPNAAHLALANLEHHLRADRSFTLITQNVDGLHQRAGSQNVIELHGNVHRTKCTNSQCTLEPYSEENLHTDSIPSCKLCGHLLRPDIVLFGEFLSPLADWQSKRSLRDCDLFLAVGTSGLVFPAANFVRSAAYVGARTIMVNLEAIDPPNPYFQEEYLGRAEEILPQLLAIGRD
ncbi:NAD-dependent deacetylase [Aerosakkonema sp. BLCC-F183]